MDNMNRAAITPAYSASDLAAATTDAHSFHAYGAKQWFQCALFLACRGYNAAEATAILYSKAMRLAADDRTGRGAKAADLIRLFDERGGNEYFAENLDAYVLNIIGEDYVAAEDAAVKAAPVALRLVWSR